jgi:hypothetical protein
MPMAWEVDEVDLNLKKNCQWNAMGRAEKMLMGGLTRIE